MGILCSNKKPGQRLLTIMTHVYVLRRLLSEETVVEAERHERAKLVHVRRAHAKILRLLENARLARDRDYVSRQT